jgi:hypothetical protein
MGMGQGILMGSLAVDLEPLDEWFIAGPYAPSSRSSAERNGASN